jgi:hypothetical protein
MLIIFRAGLAACYEHSNLLKVELWGMPRWAYPPLLGREQLFGLPRRTAKCSDGPGATCG